MAYRKWTIPEMFLLLQYPAISVEELSRILGRSEASVQCKIQDLNISSDYNRDGGMHTLRQFCLDCTENPDTCNCDPLECLGDEDTKLYLQYHHIVVTREDRKTEVIKIEKNIKPVQRIRLIV